MNNFISTLAILIYRTYGLPLQVVKYQKKSQGRGKSVDFGERTLKRRNRKNSRKPRRSTISRLFWRFNLSQEQIKGERKIADPSDVKRLEHDAGNSSIYFDREGCREEKENIVLAHLRDVYVCI